MPELDERKRIIDYDTVNDPDENYYVLADNGTEGTGKVNVKKIGPGNMISDAYSDQDTYAVGDACIHNNILYVCNTEIDTSHAFDLSEWDPDTLGNYCSKLNGDVTEIKSSLSDLLKTTTESTASITVGGCNVGWGVNYSVPTGYSLLDCHIQTVSYSGENCINIESITSSQVTGYVRNLTGNTRSIVVTVKFIFVKSGMLG